MHGMLLTNDACFNVKDGVWTPPKVALAVALLGPKFHKCHQNSRLRHKNKKCLGPKFNQMPANGSHFLCAKARLVHQNEKFNDWSTMVETYKAVLVLFMSHLNGHEHAKDHDFSQEELGPVKPIDLKRCTCCRACGTPELGHPDDHPIFARSSLLEFWNKAISFHMPTKLMSWNTPAQVGNPAKSIKVNELIRAVKKKEVWKQGKVSGAQRALTHQEFLCLLEPLKAEDQDDMHWHGLPGFFVFQHNLVARVDNSSQFLAENLRDTPNFDFVLRSKLSWQKNVHEECEAPNQILIGLMDFHCCVLLNMAVQHLETFLASALQGGLTPHVFGFSEDITVPNVHKNKNAECSPWGDVLPWIHRQGSSGDPQQSKTCGHPL
jgi:hypothetical protein